MWQHFRSTSNLNFWSNWVWILGSRLFTNNFNSSWDHLDSAPLGWLYKQRHISSELKAINNPRAKHVVASATTNLSAASWWYSNWQAFAMPFSTSDTNDYRILYSQVPPLLLAIIHLLWACPALTITICTHTWGQLVVHFFFVFKM